MKVIIIAGGTPPSIDIVKEEMKNSELIICADSGANCLYDYEICPEYLLGDFDSIDRKVLNYFSESNCTIESYPKYKDYTDTELALVKAIALGAKNIAFLGCTGTRLDHTIGNLGLLLKCLNSNVQGYIRDKHNCIQLINSPVTISGKPDENFSLLAYNSPVPNLTITNAKYSLTNYYLEVGDSLTVSNQFKSCNVEISFSSGILLLLRSND